MDLSDNPFYNCVTDQDIHHVVQEFFTAEGTILAKISVLAVSRDSVRIGLYSKNTPTGWFNETLLHTMGIVTGGQAVYLTRPHMPRYFSLMDEIKEEVGRRTKNHSAVYEVIDELKRERHNLHCKIAVIDEICNETENTYGEIHSHIEKTVKEEFYNKIKQN